MHSIHKYNNYMNILEDVNEYVDFLIKNKLTTNQFLLLYLLFTEKMVRDSKGKMQYSESGAIYKWLDKGKGWCKQEIVDLEEKGYLIPVSKDNYQIDQLIVTTKFSDVMFINLEMAFEEILDIYPDTILVEGNVVFTKSGDLERVSQEYRKIIKNSIKKHEEVKELIKFAIEEKLVKSKLDKFLTKATIDSLGRLKEQRNGTRNEF
jgi:hypothetical protein